MIHLQIFDDYNFSSIYDFKIGDYVICIKAYSETPIKNGDRCKIISINVINILIENDNGYRESYYFKRLIPECEYNANKFNL